VAFDLREAVRLREALNGPLEVALEFVLRVIAGAVVPDAGTVINPSRSASIS